ncbi:PEGA domain-containing protein [Methanocalculus sp.]|uniref:PEGA domain-containing protein n=1 Tax=Methanocalculus sp. TaxID=2004547 RepID=UPI00272D7F75|nr:PEGA domain-containing protein [Methanocalculus sp.]
MYRILVAMLLIIALLLPGAGALEAVLGETVPISGSAPGADMIYLFMTGPNLDKDGVALHNPGLLASAGQFSTAKVSSAGHWEYKWNTGGIGLDAGSYTIFAVTEPRDRSNLQGATYKTIPATLMTGTITVRQETGSLQVTVEPYGARVEVDGEYKGETPLGISLPIGTYEISISHDGYNPFSMIATIYGGSTTTIERTLIPVATRTPVPTETIPPTTEASGWIVALIGAGLLIALMVRR